jgi:6-phosphogluconolactonase
MSLENMTEIILREEHILENASEIISKSINKILDEKGNAIFGTAGGSSIFNVFRFLIYQPIDWDKIHVFMVDERLVPINHKDGNFRLISQQLINVIPKQNLHPFIFKKNDLNYGISEYENEFKQYGDGCDLILLSSGKDGHIGSLFPGHPSINDESKYFISIDNAPKPPPKRMSMSTNMIVRSDISFLMLLGKEKKYAYKKYLDTNLDYKKCPSKLVDNINESFIFTNISLE